MTHPRTQPPRRARASGAHDVSRRLPGLVVFAILAWGCSVDRPLVERHDGDSWQPADHRLVTLGGQRSGATVEFVLRLERPAGQRLSVEGRFELRPHATLIGGHWIETDGASTREGEVASAAIDFLGGQGGRPALGGQYTLSAAGQPVYRINLPSTPLSSAR